MSASTIRILDEGVSFPDIEVAADIGPTIDIGSIDALDMGLLANQKKLGSPARSSSPAFGGGSGAEIQADEIEFVSLDEAPSVSFDIKPNTMSSAPVQDTIRITRDSTAMPPMRPIAPPTPTPAASLGGGVGSSGSAAAASSSGGGIGSTFKSWFSSAPSAPAPAAESSGGFVGGVKSWFGGSSSDSSNGASAPAVRNVEYLTPEQEFARKTEALTQLERMDRKGITGNKMTMANTLDEIQAEVERRKDSKALEASLRFQRSMLTTVTNGMEFLNSRFDPLGIKLDGWSEQVSENIEDYDEIFEELYDKYKDKSKVAPEVRLIMSLGLSAAMCHVTNTMFKSKMPGMDDILRNNPDLARQFAQAAASQAVGPGFANFVGLGMNGAAAAGSSRGSSRRGSSHPMAPPAPTYNPDPVSNGMFAGFSSVAPPPSPPPIMTARREMRGPSGVEDILRTLNQAGESMPDRSVPPPASPQIEAEEVASIRSGFTTETARAAGRSRRRTTASAQPVGATLTLNV